MAKINGNEIKPGFVIEHDGSVWRALKTASVKPGKGGAFNQVELRNLLNGSKSNVRFRSSETVERVRLDQKEYQYLFSDGTSHTFMDQENYEQVTLSEDVIDPHQSRFLQDGMLVQDPDYETT